MCFGLLEKRNLLISIVQQVLPGRSQQGTSSTVLLDLCTGLKAGPGFAQQSGSIQQLQIQGDFSPPDKFCNRRETGCELQGLDVREEQR